MVSPLKCQSLSLGSFFLCVSSLLFSLLDLDFAVCAENPEEVTNQQLGLISEFNLARLLDKRSVWKKVRSISVW